MKKIILLVTILLILIIGIIILKIYNSNQEQNDEPINNESNNIEKKEVVLYFSATGNTEKIAKEIQQVIKSDIIEIIPKEEYTSADLNYNNKDCRANKEQNDKEARPEIANKIEIEDYDTIFLGYPIWWGDVPKIILTMLDNYNFSGKTIIPFCTSGSSSINQSMNTLRAYDKNVNWIDGKRFETERDVKQWIEGLNLTQNVKEEVNKMYIKINEKILTATLEDNSSVEELLNKLKQGDITIDMSDYSNFEKVGELGFNLPRNDEQISTDYGDLILYQGKSFVIYYDKNSWNFTKLGHIDDVTKSELKQILGNGNVTVTLSLNK